MNTDKRSHSPRMHSVKDIAAMLRLSTKTVRRMIVRGELRVHRLGRALRVSEEDLVAFTNRHRM